MMATRPLPRLGRQCSLGCAPTPAAAGSLVCKTSAFGSHGQPAASFTSCRARLAPPPNAACGRPARTLPAALAASLKAHRHAKAAGTTSTGTGSGQLSPSISALSSSSSLFAPAAAGTGCAHRSRISPVAAAGTDGGSNSSSTSANGGQSGATSTRGGCEYDVLVIGGGSGGVRTARTAAQLGARVALVELPLAFVASPDKGGVGGTCVLRGCVPKKLMLYASTFATELQAAKDFGWVDQSVGHLDWHAFIQAKRSELMRLNQAYKDTLSRAGVELFEGRGQLLGPNTVEIDGRQLTAKNIVIATGGQSSRIPIPGAEHAIISDQVLELESIPKVVTLIGGGYIGMEFAGMFARLGCEVHVVARQQLPLAPRFDEEVCRFFLEQCTSFSGIHMHMSSNPTAIIREPDGNLTVKLERVQQSRSGGQGEKAAAAGDGTNDDVLEIHGNQQVVLAVGRAGKTAGLGLEEAGVKLGPKGSILVDQHSRTNVPSIWAVGDVTSRIALTPVAIMEGAALGRSLATGHLEAPCYDAVPSACFSWPFVATVGLTEQQAVQQGLSFEVYTKSFTPMKASMAAQGVAHTAASAAADNSDSGSLARSNGSSHGGGVQKGFVKILAECGSGKLLGLHLVGEDAPEILQGFAMAVKLGATKQRLDSLVGIHPTAAEELLGLQGPDRTVTPADNKPEVEAPGTSHDKSESKAEVSGSNRR